LLHNPTAIDTFCDKVEGLMPKLAAHIDIRSMPNCLLDHEGADVGKFVVANLEARG
jgi:hypothetical protein